MKRVINYHIVSSPTADIVSDEVLRLCELGWELVGCVQVASSDGYTTYAQTLVQYEKD